MKSSTSSPTPVSTVPVPHHSTALSPAASPQSESATSATRTSPRHTPISAALSPLANHPMPVPAAHNTVPELSVADAIPSLPVALPVEAPPIDEAETRLQIANTLSEVFAPHLNPANRVAFDALIQQRVDRFFEMGESAQTIRATLEKGVNRDRLSSAVVGGVRSIPFGIASRVIDVVPALTNFASTPARAGALSGAYSGVVDTVGTGLLHRSTSDTHWLAAKPPFLEPVMADAQKAAEPAISRLALEAGAAVQTYTARNVYRTVLAPLVTHAFGAATGTDVDSWIAAAGSPIAGAAASLAMHFLNENHRRTGPAYLIGRTDWEAQYDALKGATWGDSLSAGAKRAAKLPADAIKDAWSSARSLVTPTNIVKNVGVMAGGFAAVAVGKNAAAVAATSAGYSEAAVAAVKQSVGLVLSAPVFSAWTTADVMTASAVDRAANYLRSLAPSS